MADTFKSVIAAFTGLNFVMHPLLSKEVNACAIKVRDDATKKFGSYQPGVGEYNAWSELKESTIKAKEKYGGSEDPLIGHYSGKHKSVWPAPLRTTIETHVKGSTTTNWVATVGTRDPLGKYHEYGVSGAGKNHDVNIPPRPFLRPALFENIDYIQNHLAAIVGSVIKKM